MKSIYNQLHLKDIQNFINICTPSVPQVIQLTILYILKKINKRDKMIFLESKTEKSELKIEMVHSF